MRAIGRSPECRVAGCQGLGISPRPILALSSGVWQNPQIPAGSADVLQDMLDTRLLIAGAVVFWLATALLAFISGRLQGRRGKGWMLICALLGPVAMLWALVPRRRPASSDASPPPRRQYSDEDFFKRPQPFSHELRELRSQGRLDEAADLMVVLLEEVESKARRLKRQVPIWYYQQLAGVYRKQGKASKERKIAHRAERQGHRL